MAPRPRSRPTSPLIVADNQPATLEALKGPGRPARRDHLRAGRIFDAEIEGGPLVPRSVLNALRRSLVEEPRRGPRSPLDTRSPRARVLPNAPARRPCSEARSRSRTRLRCRSSAGRRASDRGGRRRRDHHDLRRVPGDQALQGSRRGRPATPRDVSIYLATPRIQKPGEANIYRHLARQGADGIARPQRGGLALLRRARRSRSWPTSP